MAMFLKKTFTVSKVPKDDRLLPVEGAPRRKKTQFFKFPPWKSPVQLAESGCQSPSQFVKQILDEDEVFYPDGIVGPNVMLTDDPIRPLRPISQTHSSSSEESDTESSSEDESEEEQESYVLDEAEEDSEGDTEDSAVDCSSDEELHTSPLTPSPLKNLPSRHPLSSSSSSDEERMAVARGSVVSKSRKSVKKCRKLSSSDNESDTDEEFMFLRPPIKEAKRVHTPSPPSSPVQLKRPSKGGAVEDADENYENRVMLDTPPIKNNDESYPWPWL